MNKNIGDMTRSELIDYVIELQEENSRCEREIDKAIEYIKENACYSDGKCLCGFSNIALDKVLEILDKEGEDNCTQ